MDTAVSYHLLTEQFLALTGWTDKMAHLNAGLAIFVIARIILRTRRASLPALATVAGMEFVNEVLDVIHAGHLDAAEALTDFVYTMFWPAILTWASSYRRARWGKAREERNYRAIVAQAGQGPLLRRARSLSRARRL
jgi:hypothetical protein